ncbi:MAG: ABC transporter substrate-binding protein [Eubacteriales bacterium]|nr:ABC transporter substrate-binding protein [Eubacteriales bacterium]
MNKSQCSPVERCVFTRTRKRLCGLAVAVILILSFVFRTSVSLASEATETATDASGIVHGGKMVVAVSQEPDFLDPHRAVAAGTKEILHAIYEGLLRVNSEGQFENELAESIELSDDGKSYEIELKSGVLFHNGHELDSEDVVYSYKRAAGEIDESVKSSNKSLSQIESIETLSPLTLRITLKKANPEFRSALCEMIVPAEHADLNESPCGTGAFEFVSYRPQEVIELKRFEGHRPQGAAYLDAVDFKLVASTDAAMLNFRSGTVDVFPYLTHEMIRGLGADYKFAHGAANMIQLLALNHEDPAFSDLRVREALDLIVNRQQIVSMLAGDYSHPCYSPISRAMPDAFNDAIAFEPDLERAQALLREAGYDESRPLRFTLKVPANYKYHLDSAQILASQFQAAGVEVSVENLEWGVWLEEVYSHRNYQATIIALPPSEYSAYEVMSRYQSTAKNNFMNYKSDRYDEAFEAADAATSLEARNAAYKNCQEILHEEHAAIYLQDIDNITGLRSVVEGYRQYPAYIQPVAELYYQTPEAAEASLNR